MATTTKAAAKKTAAKPAPVEEVEAEETVEAVFGVADIVALIKTKLKQETSTRELRTLLRKMARDGRLDREIIPGNRARWEWAGPEDPEVKAILAAFKSGELEEDKQQKLAELKERKAAQKAAAAAAAEDEDEVEEDEAPAPAKKPTRRKPAAKAAPAAEVEDDDEDLED